MPCLVLLLFHRDRCRAGAIGAVISAAGIAVVIDALIAMIGGGIAVIGAAAVIGAGAADAVSRILKSI